MSDNSLRLARKTEWVDRGEDTYLGSGQRMFATDQGETALTEARQILVESAAGAGRRKESNATDDADGKEDNTPVRGVERTCSRKYSTRGPCVNGLSIQAVGTTASTTGSIAPLDCMPLAISLRGHVLFVIPIG